MEEQDSVPRTGRPRVLAVAIGLALALASAGVWARRPAITDGDRLAYQWRFDRLKVQPDRRTDVDRAVATLLQHRSKYEIVERVTEVPWYLVGTLDVMESGGGCRRHLHNGDPLTARTVQVPEGRPPDGAPPFTWYASALDALEEGGWLDREDDTLATLLYRLEQFNGWGYRGRGVPSPYIWAASDQSTPGKYVRDGVWDPTAVSKQVGAAVLLRALVDKGLIHPARWRPD